MSSEELLQEGFNDGFREASQRSFEVADARGYAWAVEGLGAALTRTSKSRQTARIDFPKDAPGTSTRSAAAPRKEGKDGKVGVGGVSGGGGGGGAGLTSSTGLDGEDNGIPGTTERTETAARRKNKRDEAVKGSSRRTGQVELEVGKGGEDPGAALTVSLAGLEVEGAQPQRWVQIKGTTGRTYMSETVD